MEIYPFGRQAKDASGSDHRPQLEGHFLRPDSGKEIPTRQITDKWAFIQLFEVSRNNRPNEFRQTIGPITYL
jgi:hypothetical protein